MAQDLEFSVMEASAVGLQPLLDEFEDQHQIHVHLRILTWDTAWSDLIKVALYTDGPDVSEIGSTWLGDLVSMEALCAFDEAYVARLGKAKAFLPQAWWACQVVNQPQLTWAIPWVSGARMIFFRRNLLAQAGIDERNAFHTAEQFSQTLSRLQTSGVAVPWTVPTGATHTTLLNAASWVWGAGGDFVTPDGKQALFNQPLARAGWRAYFGLGQYIPPAARQLTGLQPDEQFLRDANTAVTISGSWLFQQVRAQAPELAAQFGVALPPGPPFVGGSHLVIWKHCRQREAALKLIHFLTQVPAQVTHSQQIGLLPAKLEAFAAPPFSTDPLWQLTIQGLTTGRSVPATRFWGLMEDRLTTELSQIWSEVFAASPPDLEAIIGARLESLAKRLDLVLGRPS